MSDDSEPIKRAWAIIRLYPPNFSGAAIQAHRILQRVASSTREVQVLSAADHESKHLVGQKKEIDGVHVRYLRTFRRRDFRFLQRIPSVRNRLRYMSQLWQDFTFNVNVATKLLRYGSAGEVALLYSVDEFSIIVTTVCRWKRMKTIIQMSLVGADDPGSFQYSWYSVLTRMKIRAFHIADLVIGLSTALTTSCIRAGIDARKIVRIPNGVDLQTFHPPADRNQKKRDVKLDESQTHLIFVGSALHRKGIDVLIPCFVEIAKCQNVELLVVGEHEFDDGARNDQGRRDLVASLKRLISENSLQDRVHWLGQIENVSDYLQASDIFFFPTRREGLPNALAEAMACGLAVVTSKVEGVTTDLVQHEVDGLLVAGFEPEDYQEQIERLLDSRPWVQELGSRAADKIQRDFSLNLAADRYRELLFGTHSSETTTKD